MRQKPVDLDTLDRAIINRLQDGLPLVSEPFAGIAAELGLEVDDLLARVARLRETGAITRFGPFYDAAALGGAFCLCAIAVPEERFDAVAEQVNALPEVAHNYARAQAQHVVRPRHGGAGRHRGGRARDRARDGPRGAALPQARGVLHRLPGGGMSIDAIDRRIIAATQAGLPIVARPYAAVAEQTGLAEDEIVARLASMQARGIVRRIAAAPNHYALGMAANGMTVWDVDDAEASRLGALVGALDFVSHAYLRPRALPDWPYNLFAMAHGADRAEVEEKRAEIAALLGPACRSGDVLYSTRILKKTGLRLAGGAT